MMFLFMTMFFLVLTGFSIVLKNWVGVVLYAVSLILTIALWIYSKKRQTKKERYY